MNNTTKYCNMVSRLLYEVKQLPILQNRLYDTESEAKTCPRGDVKLVQNLTTGLVYNDAFRPDLIKYDDSYQNEQAVSPLFRDHLQEVVQIIEHNMGRSPLVEIGCGKGFFLEMLAARGFDVVGYDPAYEGSNPRVVKEYFRPEVGLKFPGVILRHVIEHVQDPVGFLKALRDANDGRGKIYIEAPCFEWICVHRSWFDIFYEHVNYFRISDFYRLFGTVHEAGRLFRGQYLYVVADIASVRDPRMHPIEMINFPSDFTRSFSRDGQKLNEKESNISPAAIWGAASKGVIFSLLMERINKPIQVVIDINPAKQGKYLPITGLRVCAPDEALSSLPPGATIYVMNSNYLEEIRHMSKNAYRYVGVDCG